MKRLLAAAVGVLASLVLAAPAAAFTAPELFVRTQKWDTHEETGAWIPLASAPALNYLGGYEIGYRLQDSQDANELQRVALTVTGVPDGAPTQPSNATPYCVTRAGAVGTIVAAGPELQFEGDGGYSVRVSIGAGSGGPSDCLGGPSTIGSFGVDVHVAPSLVGAPMSFRARPLPGNPFVGVQAAPPPGGEADVRCAFNATIQPDGSVAGSITIPDPSYSHPQIPERGFPRPGAWTCVARGTTEGRDDNLDTVRFGGPWSGPLPFEVHSDLRYLGERIARARTKRPRLAYTAEWPDAAQGGRATLRLSRVTGCKGRRYRLRRVATYRARFGAKRVRFTVRRPRKQGFYTARFSFGGTHFLRAVADPEPFRLQLRGKRLLYVAPRDFAGCPGYRP